MKNQYPLTDKNRLSIVNPEVCKEWDYKKNGNLKPEDVSYGSTAKVWWKCKYGHNWESTANNRTSSRNGCPYCSGRKMSDKNRLSITHPEISKEWHPTKNGDIKPEDVSYGSSKRIWWKCKNGHEWDATLSGRTKKRLIGCPHCSGRNPTLDNNLGKNKELCKEWDFDKNKKRPEDFTFNSGRIAWWKCSKGHEWKCCIHQRVNGGGKCKVCNSFALNRPKLVILWHPSRNGLLTAEKISYMSGQKVWWKCKNNHEWKAIVANISKGIGCPYCAGFLPTKDNNLGNNHELIREWNFGECSPTLKG